jgi:hypothetical protein
MWASLVALWVALISVATAFGNLHRYGSVDLLLLICLLMGLWVVSSLMTTPLRYRKSWVNPLMWALLGLMLLQISPLPGIRYLTGGSTTLGAADACLTDGLQAFYLSHVPVLGVGRYTLRPVSSSGTLILMASAVTLYWLLASSLVGRSNLRPITWAVALGMAPLALWVVLSGLEVAPAADREIFRTTSPVQILGGDSLVPALLAALPLSLAAVLRLLGWMPRRHYDRRQSRWGWMTRAAPVWAGIGLALVGLLSMALGMCNVPAWLMAVCVALSVGFVLFWYGTLPGPTFRLRRMPLLFSLLVIVWIVLGLGVGRLIGPVHQPASTANGQLWQVIHALSGQRAALGVGAGAISDRDIFGEVGWPQAPDQDHDSDGYLVLRAEIGWLGLTLVLALVAALAGHWLRGWRQAQGPWPRIMLLAGIGILAANALYFRFDASALLAPNIMALAAAGGIVTAWAGHGAAWRAERDADFRHAHWPLVVGAIGLIATMALAENEMLSGTPGHDINDKVMHFGAFGVVCLLLCYALGPRPGRRWLLRHVLVAIGVTILIAAGVEYAQLYLTANRSFEFMDAFWGSAGAVMAGVWWWAMRRIHVLETPDVLPASPEPSDD